MQDRIKQMAFEAGIDLDPHQGIARAYPVNLERFAKAIAGECAEMVQMKQYRSGRTEIDGVKHGQWPTDLAQQIRARFGIT